MGTDAINLIRGTNGQPPIDGGSILFDAKRQEFLAAAADMDDDRVGAFRLYEEYYDGEHRAELTDRAREYLDIHGITFAENFCEPLVDAIAGRLVIDGFTVTRGGKPDDDLTTKIMGWWTLGRMDSQAQAVHTMTLLLGEWFVFTDWDNDAGRPMFVSNHPRMVKAVYGDDDPDAPEYVVKVWMSTEVSDVNPSGQPIRRMNLYYPDRIERYWTATSDGKVWDIYVDAEHPTWPTWNTATGNEGGPPLGLPVAHFRNRPLARPTGRSELRSDIPMQDLHNKLVVDLAMILDSQAWAQRWVTGQSRANANIRNIPGDVWFFPDPNAAVGTFPSEDVSGVLSAIESLLSRRARRAQIPLHLLTGGDVPSGEALRAAEAGLVKKVEARMEVIGDAWEDVMRTALLMDGDDVTDLRIETTWRSAESRDEVERADAALKWKELGVSRDTLLERNGFDVEQENARRTDEESTGIGDLRALVGGINDLAPMAPMGDPAPITDNMGGTA